MADKENEPTSNSDKLIEKVVETVTLVGPISNFINGTFNVIGSLFDGKAPKARDVVSVAMPIVEADLSSGAEPTLGSDTCEGANDTKRGN